jgi:CubicO group peptidase (beta-lactamase class C family)
MDEPTELIVKDLQQFIPAYIRERGIPGCAVALIKDHEIVWQQGFGVTNSFTGKSLTEETVFEVASNSKIVTAYVALRLVTLGWLSLDDPLNNYLSDPWFPESVYRDSVTLRHVLSHSSGLGHNEKGKEIQFTPGSGFYYSNRGFSFLQEVIEEIMGASLETLAMQQAFIPLGMKASSYVNRKDFRKTSANGHVRGNYILKISAILWLVSSLLIGLPGIILLRIFRKRWIPEKREIRTGLILFLVTWLTSVFVLFGLVGWLKYAWLLVFFNMVLASSILMLSIPGSIATERLRIIPVRKKKLVKGLCAISVAIVLIFIYAGIKHIPVPRWSRINPMAEASFRTTVHDMATFLLELSEPEYLTEELSGQLHESQITLNQDLSWGLGAGILHGPQGNALWQWGQNVDFQSLTFIHLERGFGAVVFTNSDWSQPDVAIEIANRALGGDLESLRKAAHLEFNMHLEDE